MQSPSPRGAGWFSHERVADPLQWLEEQIR